MSYFISKSNLFALLDRLSEDWNVCVPKRRAGHRYFSKYIPGTNSAVLGEVRAFDPLKAFFFEPREQVAQGFEPAIPSVGQKPFCLVGVKACDLKGFAIQDFVFGDHELPDPFYKRARDRNLIIASDCTCVVDTCFCLAMGVTPYPQERFDINLAEVRGGFLVEVGSAKGQGLLDGHASLFSEAKPGYVTERDDRRTHIVALVEENLKRHRIPRQDALEGAVVRHYESPWWQAEAKNCVECGACNTICPTCHCFLLYDQKDPATRFARVRIWDSCLIKDFARVAGGANPRPHLWMRLRNRFEKKFDFFPKIAGIYACTGCGRCISACPAKIDIRRVLGKLASHGRQRQSIPTH